MMPVLYSFRIKKQQTPLVRPSLDAKGVSDHREISKWDRILNGHSNPRLGIERTPTASECACVPAKVVLF